MFDLFDLGLKLLPTEKRTRVFIILGVNTRLLLFLITFFLIYLNTQ